MSKQTEITIENLKEAGWEHVNFGYYRLGDIYLTTSHDHSVVWDKQKRKILHSGNSPRLETMEELNRVLSNP